MKNTSRRKFILNTSLATGGILVAGRIGASKKNQQAEAIACAPTSSYQLAATISSVKSGNWSDASTWGGKVPGANDTPLISSSHIVNFDLASTTVAGVYVNSGGTLSFDTTKSTTLQSTKNVLVEGKLQMRPGSAAVIQTLRFTGINENNFAGGGMDPLDSDVGLWVMGSGQLDLVGSTKTSWTRAVDSINSGATGISLQANSGWAIGDEIGITPTDSPTSSGAYLTGFEEKTITSISGTSISINSGTARSHPKVNSRWTAEVANLTRNVRIEGLSTGKSHVFVRSTVAQTIKYVQLRYLGPRKDRSGDGVKELVAGRYGLHFHHCMDGSRDSIVEGCVIRDTDNHAYVPHISYGITMKNNVAYNTTEIAFWWDPKEASHTTLWDSNLVAQCKYVGGSKDMNAEDAPTFASIGFLLGIGDDNICNNNVVVGTYGDPGVGGAFTWEADNEGIWTFNNNMAHNCVVGIRVWQNSPKKHVLENTDLYNNEAAVFHGAYANSYSFKGGNIYASVFGIEASSTDSNKVRIENISFEGGGLINNAIAIQSSPLPGSYPIFIRNCTFNNFKGAAIIDTANAELKNIDVIQCSSSGVLAALSAEATSQEVIRVQPTSGQAVRITKSGSTAIANFAATNWGTGNGLKGEYFNDGNLTTKAFERTDATVSFTEWGSIGVHYKITNLNHSVRWTGQIQAQFSEDYTFTLNSGGGHRLWIDSKLILDSWQEHYTADFRSSSIRLTAGQKYDIKLEYFNTDARTAMGLFWSSPSQPLEYVPQSQLYSTAVSTPVPPVDQNQGPKANAGPDVNLTLPANWTILDGTGSTDSDGSIVSYKWSAFSADSWYNIEYPDRASTGVYNMNPGTYVFRLQVTDNKGATATDDVTVIVSKAATTTNKAPVADAGPDVEITLPANWTMLSGSGSADPDGSIVSYKWSAASADSWYNIEYPDRATTGVYNMNPGTYVFRLQVTDNKGATATDDVTVKVNPAGSAPDPVLSVKASPNPSTSSFSLVVSGDSSLPITLIITDSSGNVRNTYSNVSNNATITTGATYRRGTYYAVAKQGNTTVTVQLIKM